MSLLQTFDLTLFSPASKRTEDEEVERVLRCVNILRDFDSAISPTFVTARSKKEAQEFSYTAEHVRELIRKNVNKEGRTQFPQLGSHFSFFSSMKNDFAAGISFTVCAQAAPATNSFAVKFPIQPSLLEQEPPFTPDRLWTLFTSCVRAFHPQSGAVYNAVNRRRFWDIQVLPHEIRPATVDWMSYYDQTMVEAIGRRRISALATLGLRTEEWEGGVFLRLLESPFDDNNPTHVELQRSANRTLGLLSMKA